MKDLNMLVKDINKNIGEIQVGIFKNIRRKNPINKLKSFAGGEARRVGKTTSKGVTNAGILADLESKYKVLSSPLQDAGAVKSFLNAVLLSTMTTKNNKNEIKNTFKSLFVQPILKGAYGGNSAKTVKNKGFNRRFIDTGQTVKNLQIKIGNTQYE